MAPLCGHWYEVLASLRRPQPHPIISLPLIPWALAQCPPTPFLASILPRFSGPGATSSRKSSRIQPQVGSVLHLCLPGEFSAIILRVIAESVYVSVLLWTTAPPRWGRGCMEGGWAGCKSIPEEPLLPESPSLLAGLIGRMAIALFHMLRESLA